MTSRSRPEPSPSRRSRRGHRLAGTRAQRDAPASGAGRRSRPRPWPLRSEPIRSTQANDRVRAALEQKELALREADAALDRVREANETLRESEEHLRRVFETAVDGIVELDQKDVVVRANRAFCAMVGLPRETIEGEPWTALAAAVKGADDAFLSLPRTGQAQIHRDGQSLHLESRTSEVPIVPPRRLLFVRDVTAGRVADQTIRSLFQFLQDRDEDRTRLLRRTNSAIEAERNRIARDLHDGPVQGVSAASLSLEAALLMIKAGEIDRGLEVLQRIRRELSAEADGLRRLMSGLRPPLLEERGLIPALRETLARFAEDQGIESGFSTRGMDKVPEDIETLAYRVVQEALSNAGKHAGASRVEVHVETAANLHAGASGAGERFLPRPRLARQGDDDRRDASNRRDRGARARAQPTLTRLFPFRRRGRWRPARGGRRRRRG